MNDDHHQFDECECVSVRVCVDVFDTFTTTKINNNNNNIICC